MATNTELIAQLYIGFYNRAPDPVGLAYWLGRMEAGVSIEDIGDSFAASPEAAETYAFFKEPGADITGFLSQVYLNVFGRPIDADGLKYYSERLASGEDPGSVVTSILGNADTNNGSPDQQYIQNKVDAGIYWAEQASKSEVEIYLPNGRLNEAASNSAHGIIEKVTADPGSVDDAKGGTDVFFPPVEPGPGPDPEPEQPGGGGGGGGGDGGGGITVPAATYGNLAAHNGANNLLVGSGNPSTGFMIGKDSSGKIELGLDVRYHQDLAEVLPSSDNSNVFLVEAGREAAVRFAYSASGINLDNYDYTLRIDTNPGAEVEFATFKLVSDGLSHYDWVQVGGAGLVFTDDGGNATTTQNIQALQYYNHGNAMKPGDQYDVNLSATFKGTSTVVAETAIVIQSNIESFGSLTDVGGNLYAGKGNPATNFHKIDIASSGIELGLGGWVAGVGNNGLTHTVGADGLQHYQLDASTARFVYSVASTDGDMLSANHFKLYIDTDDTDAVHYEVFQLGASGGNPATWNTQNSTYQWDRIDGTGPISSLVDDGGDGAAGKVTQNIMNVGWFDAKGGDDATPGRYDIKLEAIGADGVSVIGVNHIVLDIV